MLKIIKFLILISIILIASSCQKAEELFVAQIDDINVFQNNAVQLNLDLHSNEYLLADLSEHEILYENLCDLTIYPASLTKVMTMDTVLHHVSDLGERSSISYAQINALIAEDASIAYLKSDYEYTIEDLLYALILPSGADGAVALENCFQEKITTCLESKRFSGKVCLRMKKSNMQKNVQRGTISIKNIWDH